MTSFEKCLISSWLEETPNPLCQEFSVTRFNICAQGFDVQEWGYPLRSHVDSGTEVWGRSGGNSLGPCELWSNSSSEGLQGSSPWHVTDNCLSGIALSQ